MENTIKVVMLSTEDLTPALFLKDDDFLINNNLNMKKWWDVTSQHLYLISNENIKKGDWCINEKYPDKPFKNINLEKGQGAIKIVATTDTKLKVKCKKSTKIIGQKIIVSLPQIPQSFLEEYCKQGGIDEVELEYEYVDGLYSKHKTTRPLLIKLTTNNEVIVHLIEEKMYTKEEMQKCWSEGRNSGITSINNDRYDEDYKIIQFKDWIKENL